MTDYIIIARCNLTFLTIQEPGISKYCARCGRQFLDPGKAPAFLSPQNGTDEVVGEGASEPSNSSQSLTYQLFRTFNICPYCDGKFKG